MTEPIIKWRTAYKHNRILCVKCSKETNCFVWVIAQIRPDGYEENLRKPVKERKDSISAVFHDTWEDAHAYLMEKAETALRSAKRQVDLKRTQLEDVKSMKKPEQANV